MSGLACHAPFVSMELDPAGNVFTCCANQLYPMGHVAEASLADIWAGPRAEALRAALGAGDLTLGCNSCRWALEHGNDQPIARLYDEYPVTSTAPPHPQRMTFALSNRCNLECVMCNGELSSKIRAREGRAPLPAAYGDDFFVQLDGFLPHLVQASFLGGEPFLIAENYRVWDQLVAQGLAPRCAVVTNGTRLDAKVEAVLARLPFDVTVSLDGTTAGTVEAIRRNVDFDEVLANARRFHRYTREAGTAFGFNFCLTPDNWAELGAFLAFADGWDADVRVISVSEPGHSLHDLAEADLAAVLRAFEAEDRHRATALRRNRHAWEVELDQVRRVLAERRAGVPVAIRQPLPIAGDLVDRPGGSPGPAADHDARDRMVRWAAGGAVVRLEVGPDGVVQAATVEGPRAAPDIEPDLAVGATVDDAVRVAAGDGRSFYAVERVAEAGVVDQTLLATDGAPARGGEGAVVRVVSVATADGGTVTYLATDRFYDRAPAERV